MTVIGHNRACERAMLSFRAGLEYCACVSACLWVPPPRWRQWRSRLPARADVLITIDKSTQQMTVTVDGSARYVWPVSTGAPGYDTPSGEFKPFRMEADHFSREWDDAPMPHSIFFTQLGHAIHGSNDQEHRPAGLAWLRAAGTEERRRSCSRWSSRST